LKIETGTGGTSTYSLSKWANEAKQGHALNSEPRGVWTQGAYLMNFAFMLFPLLSLQGVPRAIPLLVRRHRWDFGEPISHGLSSTLNRVQTNIRFLGSLGING